MTTQQRQNLKRLKAAAILKCAEMIAQYCDADPAKIFTEVQSKCPRVREARSILVYHLHHCGMSFDRIGKLVRRSCDFCQRTHKQALISLMADDRKLLARLPSVPNSLEQTACKSNGI